jgi:hypothetical protein
LLEPAGRNLTSDRRIPGVSEVRRPKHAADGGHLNTIAATFSVERLESGDLEPDVILSHATPTTAALLQQTHTIPIVFALVSDPIGSGFVASFPRPGGNVTGFDVSEPTQGGKWVELLKEIAPRVARVAMLFNPASAAYAEFWLKPFTAAAAVFAAQAISAPVRNESELASVIAEQAREPNSGLIVMPDSFLIAHRAETTSLAAQYLSLLSIRIVYSPKPAACYPTELTRPTIFGARRSMSIAFSRARSRASFPSRPQSSSSWS